MEQPEQVVVTTEEFKLWADHPITKKVVTDLLNMREQLKEYMASGATLAKDTDINTDRIVGRIEGLAELFNLFDNVEEDTKEKPSYGH